MRAATIEQPANLIFEIFWQARLRQERIGTGLQRALLDGLVGVAREEDHRYVTGARLGLEVLDRGDAVDSRHREVHHDHVGPVPRGRHDAALAVVRRRYPEAERPEVLRVQVAYVGPVIHDEDQSAVLPAADAGTTPPAHGYM